MTNPLSYDMPLTTREDYLGLLRFSLVVCPVFILMSLLLVVLNPPDERVRAAIVFGATFATSSTLMGALAVRRYRRNGGFWRFSREDHRRIARMGWVVPFSVALAVFGGGFLRSAVEDSTVAVAVMAGVWAGAMALLLAAAIHEVRRRAWEK